MPIQIQFDQGVAGPVAICDHCGKRIDKATDGNALWLGDYTLKEHHTIGPIVFTHKACNQLFERAHRPTNSKHCWGANDLDVFMAYLIENLKLNLPAAKERADFLSTIG